MVSPGEIERRKKISSSLKKLFKEGKRVGWNKGLNKENSEIMKNAAEKMSESFKRGYKEGTRVCWSEGLTKETDPRVMEASIKRSKTLKELYDKGLMKAWATGLTKETDERVRQHSEFMKLLYMEHPEKHPNVISAKKNKNGTTYIEKLMGKMLDSANVEYIPQYPIVYRKGSGCVKFVDFLLPKHNMVVECDGEDWHNKEDDDKRDKIILDVLGDNWRIEHITGKEIFEFAQFFGFRRWPERGRKHGL